MGKVIDIIEARPNIGSIDDYFLRNHSLPHFSQTVYEGLVGVEMSSNQPVLLEATAIAMPSFRVLANKIFACIHNCEFVSMTFNSDTTATGPDNACKDASLKLGYKTGVVSLAAAKRRPFDSLQVEGVANLSHFNDAERSYLQSESQVAYLPEITQKICEEIFPGHKVIDISDTFRKLSIDWILGNLGNKKSVEGDYTLMTPENSEPSAMFHCFYFDSAGAEKYAFIPVDVINGILTGDIDSTTRFIEQQNQEYQSRLMGFVGYMSILAEQYDRNQVLEKVLVRPTAEFYYSQVPMYQGLISLIGAAGLIDDLDDEYFGPRYRQGLLDINSLPVGNEFPVLDYGNVVQSPDNYKGYDNYNNGRQRITTPDGKLMGFGVIPKELRHAEIIQRIIYECSVNVEKRLTNESNVIDCQYDAAEYNKRVFTVIYEEIARVIVDSDVVGDVAVEVSKLMYNNSK